MAGSDDILVTAVNPYKRPKGHFRNVREALSKTPEYGAIKVKTYQEVLSYKKLCHMRRLKEPGFRQRVEKLADGTGWICFKNIAEAERFFRQ